MPFIYRQFICGVLVIAISLLFENSACAASQPTGQIIGSVLDSSAKTINRAYVTALVQPTTSSTQPFSTTVSTDSTGKFTLTGIPDGTFTICVQVPGSNYLNPCQWSATPPNVTVKNGQTVNMPAISLALGYRYQVRFNDPTSAIQSPTAKSGAQLLMYVWTKGYSTSLLWGSDDATGRVYQALIPYATPLRITLQGKKYHVVDQSGAVVDLASGVTMSVNMPVPAAAAAAATVTSPDLTYQITRVDP